MGILVGVVLLLGEKAGGVPQVVVKSDVTGMRGELAFRTSWIF